VTEQLRVGVFFGKPFVEHEVSVIRRSRRWRAPPGSFRTGARVHRKEDGELLQLERYKDIDRLIAASTRVTIAS